MLERLNEIDWENLKAVHLPALITGLASHNSEIRLNAYKVLEEELAPSGSGHADYDDDAIVRLLSTEIPAVVVPFLIELLVADEVEGKSGILQLLLDLSHYKGIVPDLEPQKTHAERIFEAVKNGEDVYQVLLHDRNPSVKMSALQLIGRIQKP